MEELKIYGTNRMHYLALMNLVVGVIIVIAATHCTPLIYTYEYVITVHPACKARRARIRFPISRIRKLKVSSAEGITQQVMRELRPEPAVLTRNSSPLGYLNQPHLETEHGREKREDNITPTE